MVEMTWMEIYEKCESFHIFRYIKLTNYREGVQRRYKWSSRSFFSFSMTCNSYFLKWIVKPRANGRNIVSQQLCLQVAKSLTCFKLFATTYNRVCKRTQHDIQQCWELLVNNVVVLKLRANGRIVVTLLLHCCVEISPFYTFLFW